MTVRKNLKTGFKEKFQKERALADEIIRKQIRKRESEYYGPLYKAMRYSLFTGGKRVRPVIVKLCARLGSPREGKLEAAMTAIEYIHTYSLIHDDLPSMDDDNMRRGKPSVHVKFGEAMAILAGDALLTEAFRVAASSGDCRISLVLAENAGAAGMVAGQAADIYGDEKEDFINDLKTAKLFKASAVIGGIAGGLNRKRLDKLALYGENLGKAFQLRDDILDEEASPEAFLKAKEYIKEAKRALKKEGEGSEILFGMANFMINRNR